MPQGFRASGSLRITWPPGIGSSRSSTGCAARTHIGPSSRDMIRCDHAPVPGTIERTLEVVDWHYGGAVGWLLVERPPTVRARTPARAAFRRSLNSRTTASNTMAPGARGQHEIGGIGASTALASATPACCFWSLRRSPSGSGCLCMPPEPSTRPSCRRSMRAFRSGRPARPCEGLRDRRDRHADVELLRG